MKIGRLVSCLVLVVAFVVAMASSADAAAGAARPIRLKAVTIDTSQPPTPQAEGQGRPAGVSGYYIVQAARAADRAFAQALDAQGASVVSYVPEDAFLVKATPAAMGRVRRLESVHWTGPYRAEYKLSPRIRQDALRGKRAERLTVLAFKDADVRAIAAALQQQGLGLDAYSAGSRFHYFTIKNPPGLRLDRIAALEGVAWIEPQRALELVQAPPPGITGDVPADIMNFEEVWDTGIDGTDQIVGICDTGLDVGINGPPLLDDFEGRLAMVFALGRPGDWSDDHGHGTHVAGIAIGNGAMSGGLFRGAAFAAELVFQSAYVDEDDPIGGIPSNLYTLFDQAYGAGARIHSDSWGSPDQGSYSAYSQQVDEFMWDHKDMLIVFAAGNDGVDVNEDGVIDDGSLHSPATAKNCLAVGASENVRESGGLSDYTWGLLGILDGTWQAEPIYSDYISDNEDGLAAFSSHGPCDDGRIKPDVVAPGTDIISCRTQDPVGYSLVDWNTWGAYNDYYVYMGGTSMAAPAAAGAATLARHYLVDEASITNPSAALVKATLINGAYDMTPGQYGPGPSQEMGPRPNSAEGWGRVDLAASLLAPTTSEISFYDVQPGLSTGEYDDYVIIVGDPSVPLRVTLAYTDYPGNPAASIQLVNDLDLTVTGGGPIYYPNGLGAPDRRNNVELVEIPTPDAGAYTVRVSAHTTPYGPQPYALVVARGQATGIGHVVLDKTAYGAADTHAAITVIDLDIAGAGTQSVTATSTTDTLGETVVLTETAPGSGVFAGQVGLTTGLPGVGEIQIAHGDTITVLYHDANHGGSPQDVTDTAGVDLVYPTITGTSVLLVEPERAVIGWSTSEACTGVVHYGPLPALGEQAVSGVLTTSRTVELPGLQPNTRYYFSVESADAAGNTTTDDNGGALYTFATGYGAETFADDMEQGPDGWTHTGDFDQWEHGVPTYLAGPSSAHSPDNCWGTDLDSYFTHDDFFSGYWIEELLVSPSIDVGDAAQLTFWHWYDLVDGSDEMYVEVSVGGGAWQNVTPGTYYGGASYAWVKESIDLSGFGGSTIRVRFHIWADTWFDYLDPHAGWYVDDVTVSTMHAFGYGSIMFDRNAYGLATPVVVTVTDGDENDDPLVVDTLTVNVASDSEPAGETLILTETGANTGVFAGTISLSGVVMPGDTQVGVADGDEIRATYTDLDDGAGHTNQVRTATATADLVGPPLGGLSVGGVSTSGALIEFTSDPDTTATIAYGTAGAYDHEVSATSADGSFSFVLADLDDNTLYSFVITLEDEAGNAIPYSTPPEDYQFGTRAKRTYVANEFGGETSALQFSSDNDVWELGTPEIGPPAAHSAPDCWATDLDGPYPITCEVSLTSDWITLRPDSEFAFWHWYSINEYMLEDAYGRVEITTNGTVWTDVTPVEGGYIGSTADWEPVTVDLASYGADDVRLRFRLYSEESDIVYYTYAGWYVDDVALVQTIPFGKGSLFFDRDVYSLSTPVEIMLIDAHLNTDPASTDTVLLSVTSSLETLDVLFTETAPNSGKFAAVVTLDDGAPAADALLQVAPTDTITVEYNDADDGTGSPALASAQADVDLIPPVISGLTFSDVSDTGFVASWTTDTPCIGTVYYGKTTDTAEVMWSVGYVTSHGLPVDGLDENTGYFVKVTATDEAGNVTVNDNGGSWHRVYTDVRQELFRDDFDRDDKGWTHSGLGDDWERGVPGFGVTSAASPPNCWATDLDGTYPGSIDAALRSPGIDLSAGAWLSFNHWYNIEEFGLDDGMGFVEVSTNGTDWTNISRDGGYTGPAKPGWHREALSLDAFGASTVDVRFRLSAEQTIEYYYPGWYIDDVSVYVLKPYGHGVLLLDRQLYTVVDQVVVTLKDGHLNTDPTLVETALVEISSTTHPAPMGVVLVETDAASGIFEAAVPIAMFEGSGSLKVADGDTITAEYTDADDAEGGSDVLVTAQALVSILDTDGDGLPNAWEEEHGLDPGSSVGDDGADGDPDGDSRTNHDELVADTDPQDPASRLAVVELEELANGRVVVHWQSRPHKVYRIYTSTNPGTWATGPILNSSGDETEWTDVFASAFAKRFYRVLVVE